MLFVLFGKDTIKKTSRIRQLLRTHISEDAEPITLSHTAIFESELERLCSGASLFGETFFVRVDILENDTTWFEIVTERAIGLHQSSTIFVVNVDTLTKDEQKQLSKLGVVIEEFPLKKTAERSFNTFLITDAFAQGDKKEVWLLYREAISQHVDPREIHGALVWCVKSMLLAIGAKNAEEAGLHPFVFTKLKSSVRLFTEKKLLSFLRELIVLYHSAGRGSVDLEIGVEQFLLGVF